MGGLGCLGAANNTQARTIGIQCPYGGPAILQLRSRWRRTECRCLLAGETSGAVFKTRALRKAGCPKAMGLYSDIRCEYKSGKWTRF